MHADDTIYTRIKNGVVVVSGTGPAIRIDGGRLVIRDGPLETPPLRLTRAEAHRRLRHVIVCGDAGGYVSFAALRWLRDTGVAFSQLDWNGTVIAASPTIPDQPALRRAQALVSSGAVPGAVAAVTRQRSCQSSSPDRRGWQSCLRPPHTPKHKQSTASPWL